MHYIYLTYTCVSKGASDTKLTKNIFRLATVLGMC